MLKTEGRAYIGTIQVAKSSRLEIHVVRHESKRDSEGNEITQDYIDVRTWFANAYAGGAWTPTKKGIHFPIKLADQVIEKILAAKNFDPANLTLDEVTNVEG